MLVQPQHREIVVERLHRALLDGELLSRTALSAETRLSGGVLGAVLQDLKDRKAVVHPDIDQPGLRGPKSRIKLDRTRGRVLAVGLGHDRLSVAVTDLSATMLENGDRPGTSGPSDWVLREPTEALTQAADVAREALAATSGVRGPADLVGIGISISAPLMEDGRPYEGFMDRWQPRNIAEEFKTQLGLDQSLPVVLGNDADLIALRESRWGAARDASHACVVRWGTGIGAGLIIDGRIYRGPRGLVGEIGHVRTSKHVPDPKERDDPKSRQIAKFLANSPPDKRRCDRCELPCLEALIGGEGILRYLRNVGHEQPSIAAAIGAAEDDEEVLGAFQAAAHLLGHKVGPIVSALNLERVVIGAFDNAAYQLIGDSFSDGLRDRMTPAAYQQIEVRPVECGPAAAILGAADLVLQRHLARWVSDLPPST